MGSRARASVSLMEISIVRYLAFVKMYLIYFAATGKIVLALISGAW